MSIIVGSLLPLGAMIASMRYGVREQEKVQANGQIYQECDPRDSLCIPDESGVHRDTLLNDTNSLDDD